MATNMMRKTSPNPTPTTASRPQFKETSAQVDVSDRNTVVVQLNSYQGKQGLDIRTWYTDPNSDDPDLLRPTQKGVRVPLELAEELYSAITAVLEEAGWPLFAAKPNR